MPIKIIPEADKGLFTEDVRAMTATEFNDAYADFGRYFRTKNSMPLTQDEEILEWSALADLVRNSGIVGHKGVVVYHGLSGDQLQYGFRIVEFKPMVAVPPAFEDFDLNPRIETGATGQFPTHVLNGATNKLDPAPANWNQRVADYAEVQVDRDGSGPLALHQIDISSTDPLKITFPWEEEIFKLWFDNRSGFGLNNAFLRIRSIAMYHQNEPIRGYRHGIGMNMRYYDAHGTAVDLVNNTDEVLAYMNKAADLGHRCPPRCNKYKNPT